MIAAFLLLAAASTDPIAGTWEGSSLCQVKPSPCHDEHVIYHATPTVVRSYNFAAYKLTDGKEQFIGTMDLKFDPAAGQLHGTIAGSRVSGHILFTVESNHLSGRMTLGDGTLFRLIEVTKH